MTTIRVQANLSSEELLNAVAQLSRPDLEEFVSEVLSLQAQRKAPSLSKAEEELMVKLNRGVAGEVQRRYDELSAKRASETLAPAEHAELLRLTEQIESLQAERVECLAELARIRKTTLSALIKSLGIPTPKHA